ncbi:hypothetical protein BH11MYX3_BH11MYX3_04720 [soil metagenome]
MTITPAKPAPDDSEWTRSRIAAGASVATLTELQPRPGGVYAGTTSFLALPEIVERFVAAGAIDERPAPPANAN